jgi:hypothetical protein
MPSEPYLGLKDSLMFISGGRPALGNPNPLAAKRGNAA